MFYGQLDKQGMVIDERFNAGGQLADRFLELIKRPVVYNLYWRHGNIKYLCPKLWILTGGYHLRKQLWKCSHQLPGSGERPTPRLEMLRLDLIQDFAP